MMTFCELSALYFNKRAQRLARPDSYDSRIRPALTRFGSFLITDISASLIEDWRAELERPRLIHGSRQRPEAATVNRQVAELRRVLGWAVKRGLLAVAPRIELEQEDNLRDRRVSPEEEDRLLNASPNLLRALMILALDCGARRGEMMALTVASIDLQRSTIRLRGATTKAGKTRDVPINTVRLRSVLEWLIKRAGEQQLTGGRLIGVKSFRHLWEGTCDRTGTDDLHWHDLRHEFASRLAEQGVPITEIQRLLGHASILTTQRYISHTLARLSTSAQRLEQGKAFEAV